jgi:hypothetical protein
VIVGLAERRHDVAAVRSTMFSMRSGQVTNRPSATYIVPSTNSDPLNQWPSVYAVAPEGLPWPADKMPTAQVVATNTTSKTTCAGTPLKLGKGSLANRSTEGAWLSSPAEAGRYAGTSGAP